MDQPEQLTQAMLKALLHYDPATGIFTWRTRINKTWRTRVGNRAGGIRGNGYWCIRLNGRSYRAHRLVWLYMYGHFPGGDLDHKNGIKTDCRIANLRLATESQNGANAKLSRANRSGFKGVVWSKENDKYNANIRFRGKTTNLGLYKTAREAALVYDYAAKRVFGEFALTNKAIGLLG